MSSSIYPDELVSRLFDEIAYNKGRISLSQLWNIAKDLIVINDDSIKRFIFSSLISNADISLFRSNKLLDKVTYDDIKNDEDFISIGINEDKLWKTLTGYNKKESVIGNAAFELLLEIAKSREKGINTMDLAKNTKQDSRSITGRIKKLSHLITNVQLVYKGHLVKHLTLKKFQSKVVEEKPYIKMRDQLGTIVKVVKNSKNGVRQTTDLKRELKFDKERRLAKAFISAISWLDEKGYLQKVMVVSPTNPSIKIRCVKYICDYIDDNKKTNSYPDENESSDDAEGERDEINDIRQDEDEEVEGLDYFNATSLLQDQGLVMEDQVQTKKNEVLLNRFFPLQNQTYDLTAKTGTKGLSTMKAINSIVGKDYQRAFAKSSEYYIQTVGKDKLDSSGLNLVRIYDFEGKKKFFRLFTEENFKKMMNSSTPNEPERLKALKSQKLSLEQLNKKNFVLLNNTLRFGADGNGNEVFFWHGSNIVPLKTKEVKKISKEKKKRQEMDELSDIENPKPKKIKQLPPDDLSISDIPEESLVELAEPKIEKLNNRTIHIDGFSANSLKSLQRQRALLEVVRNMGGITFLKESLFDNLSKALGSQTLVDKKTVRGDVDLMVKNGKLLVWFDPKTKKRLIFLPELGEEDLEEYLNKEKNKKKKLFAATMHTTDLYFFDQTAKSKFHKSVKSVERIRNFQSKNKANDQGFGYKPERKRREKSSTKTKKQDRPSRKRKDSLFSSLSEKDRSSEEGITLITSKKITFHVGKQSGIEALIMAVVITKSITNEIQWDKISFLFPKNSVANLKKQWMVRRVRMGHNGWKAYVDKWKRILVQAITSERVSLQDAENVDLPVLVKLWINFEKSRKDRTTALYKDYDTNIKKYTLVQEPAPHSSQTGLVMSSMVQREASSLKHTFTYNTNDVHTEDYEKKTREDGIKTIIRSILMDKVETGKEEIELLKDIPKDELDKIVLDLAKAKQIYLHGSKLETSPMIKELLGTKGSFRAFEESVAYCNKMEDQLLAQNGVIISQEITDIASWQLIDLIARKKANLNVIPFERDIGRFHYTTRKFEIETLTPPLIYSLKKDRKQLFSPSISVPVPMGTAYSRLWINSAGELREDIWKSMTSLVINEILFSPGIMIERLESACFHFFSAQEINDICNWLVEKGLIEELPFNGYLATYKWYKLLC